MFCNICGRQIENENTNFCENCGTSLRDMKSTNYQEYVVSKPTPEAQPVTTKSDSISFKTFFGIMMLQVIPLFGWLI